MKRVIQLIIIGLLIAPSMASEQYRKRTLEVKRIFADRESKAIAEPFVGVTTNGKVQPGLFPLKASGISTAPVRLAAEAFLELLTPAQKVRTQFSVEDLEWRRWFNVDSGIYVRQGVSLREMSPDQRVAAWGLVRASMSARGLTLSRDIMKTDEALREINQDNLSYDEQLYFFTVMGIPSEDEPWGWQLDGHHLVINFFVMNDQVVMTPSFLGAEPVSIHSGTYSGNVVLQQEQDMGLALMQSLNENQRRSATLASIKTGNSNQGEALKDNLVLEYSGIPARDFNPDQRQQLVSLIDQYVGNMRDGHANIWMDQVNAHLDDTWFSWVGDVSDAAVFYYRIHSPIILIEFDHQLPVGTELFNPPDQVTRDHIHTVIRTPNGNDYGKDLLRQHLENHPHR